MERKGNVISFAEFKRNDLETKPKVQQISAVRADAQEKHSTKIGRLVLLPGDNLTFISVIGDYAHSMKYLESRKERAGGELTITGTRIRIGQVINMLANGYTIEKLHEGWPWIPIATLRGAVEEATQLLSASSHA